MMMIVVMMIAVVMDAADCSAQANTEKTAGKVCGRVERWR